MTDPGTITLLIDDVRAGKSAAAVEIWHRYYDQLIRLARQRLRSVPRRVSDEEDVALSAFDAFLGGVEQGRFPKLDDRDDLWQVLVMLTVRKATNQVKHERRQKRGGGAVRGESIFENPDSDGRGLEQVAAASPSLEFAGQIGEECRHLLEKLGDKSLRAVAIAKMEGHLNEEIAGQLGVDVRTIERKLRTIRQIWISAGMS